MFDPNFSIRIGEYEVLESGTIVSIQDAPVLFQLGSLSITLNFEDSEEVEGMHVNSNVEDNTHAVLTFVNFNSSIGGGNIQPFRVGTYNGHDLSLLIRVSQLREGGKTIFYTWLIGGDHHE